MVIQRIVHDPHLMELWRHLGYQVVALSYTGILGVDSRLAFHLEKQL